MSELIKLNPEEYGLKSNEAKTIEKAFVPMIEKMNDLEEQFNEVMALPYDSDKVKQCKRLRLDYVKVRTATSSIHKEAKSYYLAGGRFVDGWKNAQAFASQGKENALLEIEKQEERIEAERIEKVDSERCQAVSKFDVDGSGLFLGKMSDEVWNSYFKGVKENYRIKKEAEEQVERERIEKERAEKEERERVEKENEKLKAEAKERERLAEIESEKQRKLDAERLAKEEAKRKEHEAELKAAREENERIEREAKAKEERLQAELKAKEEAEVKRIQEEEERLQAELKKGDSAKVEDLISDLSDLKSKYSFKSKANQKKYNEVSILIDKVINHIQK